jgi:hypothetical protein
VILKHRSLCHQQLGLTWAGGSVSLTLSTAKPVAREILNLPHHAHLRCPNPWSNKLLMNWPFKGLPRCIMHRIHLAFLKISTTLYERKLINKKTRFIWIHQCFAYPPDICIVCMGHLSWGRTLVHSGISYCCIDNHYRLGSMCPELWLDGCSGLGRLHFRTRHYRPRKVQNKWKGISTRKYRNWNMYS